MEQLAQLPDAVVTKTADTFLQQGILGAVCVVLLAAIIWGFRQLLRCLEASGERQAAQATIMAEHKATGEKVADAMESLARRMEAMERALERLTVRPPA